MTIVRDSLVGHRDQKTDESFFVCKMLITQTKLKVVLEPENSSSPSNTSNFIASVCAGMNGDSSTTCSGSNSANLMGTTDSANSGSVWSGNGNGIGNGNGNSGDRGNSNSSVSNSSRTATAARSPNNSGNYDRSCSVPVTNSSDYINTNPNRNDHTNYAIYHTQASKKIIISPTKKFTTYALQPVSGPYNRTYDCSKYVFIMNGEHKITKICNLFRVSNHVPVFI